MDGQGREIPLNLYRHGAPLPVRVIENRRLTPADSPNEVHHVVVRFDPELFHFLPGQSVGFNPPGLNVRGRPHVPRLYSIACDETGEQGMRGTLAVCVKRVRFVTETGDPGHGLASNMLCDAQPGDELPMTGPAGKDFVLPDDPAVNLLLVATGTGVSPFRGFLQARARQTHHGKTHLFFGAQTRSDVLYADAWQAWAAQDPGFQVTYALSREQQTEDGRRMYVQDRLRERAAEVWALLSDPKTHVYICGLKGMETGIEDALADIAAQSGQVWADVKQGMRVAGRWHVEVY